MVDFFIFIALLINHETREVGYVSFPVATAEECRAAEEDLKTQLPMGFGVELRTACVPSDRLTTVE